MKIKPKQKNYAARRLESSENRKDSTLCISSKVSTIRNGETAECSTEHPADGFNHITAYDEGGKIFTHLFEGIALKQAYAVGSIGVSTLAAAALYSMELLLLRC